jgi:hypothetical protein
MKSWKSDIRAILEAALRAPSGDNTQPWRVIVGAHTCDIWWHRPHEPHTIHVHDELFDFLSIGTFIEHIDILAKEFRYETMCQYMPDKSDTAYVARITFHTNTRLTEDPLIAAIPRRYTDRSPYNMHTLKARDEELITAELAHTPLHVQLFKRSCDVRTIISFVTQYDTLLFSNKTIHQRFFDLVHWSRKVHTERKIGFYYPSLKIPLFQLPSFWLLQYWWLSKVGSLLGLHHLAAYLQGRTYAKASAIGILYGKSNSRTDWLIAGRGLARVWLRVTQQHMLFQPLCGALALHTALKKPDTAHLFSKRQRMRLLGSYQQFYKSTGFEDETIYFIFRIGYGRQQHTPTKRRSFDEIVTFMND